MTYSNMDNVPTQTAGTSELLASDWNTYVRDNFDAIKFGHIVVADATARTNLGNVAEGTMVYQSDNNKVYVNSNGTTANWVEVADLDNTGAVSDTTQGYLDDYAVQSRNVIINGAMQVAQRATSVASITTAGYRTVDRWKPSFSSLGTWTLSQESDAPAGSGFVKSAKVLCTTANASPSASNVAGFQQLIEGQNLQHFLKGSSSAKKFSLQFWVKSNKTGTYIVALYDPTNSRSVSASYTISASATWEKKTIVFPADTTGAITGDNTAGLYLDFGLAAGSNYTSGTLATTWGSYTAANYFVGQTNLAAATNNYWQITGVQLEAGDYNTPFEFEPYETTLRKCFRYYFRIGGNNVRVGPGYYYNATTVTGDMLIPVAMRTTPVVDAGTGTSYFGMVCNGVIDSFDTIATDTSSPTVLGIVGTGNVAGTGGQAGYVITYNASAHISASAEL